MPLPSHLFVSESSGALYDTRDSNWSLKRPLRPNYKRHARTVETLADVKAALRAGGFAFPGGYPLYFITRDGAALSFEAVREMWREVVAEFLADSSTGWRIEAVAINEEDSDLTCDHTGAPIPSAYGDDDDAAPGEES